MINLLVGENCQLTDNIYLSIPNFKGCQFDYTENISRYLFVQEWTTGLAVIGFFSSVLFYLQMRLSD